MEELPTVPNNLLAINQLVRTCMFLSQTDYPDVVKIQLQMLLLHILLKTLNPQYSVSGTHHQLLLDLLHNVSGERLYQDAIGSPP